MYIHFLFLVPDKVSISKNLSFLPLLLTKHIEYKSV